MPLVFFYGTLMRGGANHHVLARLGARFVAQATTKAPRTLVDLGPYPALLPEDGADRETSCPVAGEVWEIAESAFEDLDDFEGCPDLYRRESVVLVSDGEKNELEAFVYVLVQPAPSHARIITTGRYASSGLPLPHGASADQIEKKGG